MEVMDNFNEIIASDLPDLEKLKQTFFLITQSYLDHSAKEIELLKAMGDQENFVKEQIKQSTVQHLRGIFADCYFHIKGEKLQDE